MASSGKIWSLIKSRNSPPAAAMSGESLGKVLKPGFAFMGAELAWSLWSRGGDGSAEERTRENQLVVPDTNLNVR